MLSWCQLCRQWRHCRLSLWQRTLSWHYEDSRFPGIDWEKTKPKPNLGHSANEWRNTHFTQGLWPLYLPCATTKLARSPLKAEGRPNGCLGRSRVAHRTFRHRHGRHGRREILSMFKTVAQRSPRRSVAHRSLKGGRMKAHTSPWSQNGCTVVGHWSPSKKCEHCVSIWATRLPSLYHHCASFGRPMESIERSLWRPLCLHSATTATLEPQWHTFRSVTPVCFGVSISNFKYMLFVTMGKTYWFSAMPLWKWPPGVYIGFFDLQTLKL